LLETRNKPYTTTLATSKNQHRDLKQIIHLTLILLLFISCNNKLNIQPKYSDFKTDLETKNLFGKVKEFSQFRENIKSSNNNKTKESIIKQKETFTKNGSLKKSEYFDSFGKTQQTTENIYDGNNNLLKSITLNANYPQKMLELIERDTIKKTEFRKITINDTLNFEFHSTFGKFNKIQKQMKIENRDTTIINYNYVFDKNNNVIKLEQIEKDNIIVNEYKYNEDGNVTESVTGTDIFNFKSIRKYQNKQLSMVTRYNSYSDLKEILIEITLYDKYYNPINEKKYENAELHREIKNKYEFDKNGNWIKKTVYLKEHFANAEKFIPIYIESREIKYWE
jgi:hypothetical protein